MNIEQLRQALKQKWLGYYQENRHWLTRLGVWVNCEGQRRPSSSFILSALSVLEPELAALLPLVVDLNSNPDRIVIALGLNFNPDEELEHLTSVKAEITQDFDRQDGVKLLPARENSPIPMPDRATRIAKKDDFCEGSGRDHK